jgi:formylglycine-generating enzyme required for sulfatase activity
MSIRCPLPVGTRPARAAGRRWQAALLVLACTLFGAATGARAAEPDRAGIDWVRVGTFEIARSETTVGQYRRFVDATGSVSRAERAGGGEVYETGWVRKAGWTWASPFGGGRRADGDEPAVHLTFDEAQAFCRWAGGRLPTDAEWVSAAYTEQRDTPPAPFRRGQRYPYPTGESPAGAQCLGDCGHAAALRAVRHGAALTRGAGHARAGSTPAGVNGLHEMGGNAWEWVDEPPGDAPGLEKRTRGGSWWYGAAQMRADHLQGKPRQTAVVYVGFRCARGG